MVVSPAQAPWRGSGGVQKGAGTAIQIDAACVARVSVQALQEDQSASPPELQRPYSTHNTSDAQLICGYICSALITHCTSEGWGSPDWQWHHLTTSSDSKHTHQLLATAEVPTIHF